MGAICRDKSNGIESIGAILDSTTSMTNQPSASHAIVVDRYTASPRRVRRLLEDIADMEGPRSTLYIRPETLSSPVEIEKLAAHDDMTGGWIGNIVAAVGDSETGAAVYRAGRKYWAVLPPFQVGEDQFASETDSSGMLQVLERDVVTGVVLLRMGRYAIGVVRGSSLLESKTDTRHVKRRHRAGGSSQRRFMRSRDRLIRELYDEACQVTRRLFEPRMHEMDCVLTGGERQTIVGFLKRCAFLEKADLPVMRRLLSVDRPNREALEGIHREIWKSRVLVFEQRS